MLPYGTSFTLICSSPQINDLVPKITFFVFVNLGQICSHTDFYYVTAC